MRVKKFTKSLGSGEIGIRKLRQVLREHELNRNPNALMETLLQASLELNRYQDNSHRYIKRVQSLIDEYHNKWKKVDAEVKYLVGK